MRGFLYWGTAAGDGQLRVDRRRRVNLRQRSSEGVAAWSERFAVVEIGSVTSRPASFRRSIGRRSVLMLRLDGRMRIERCWPPGAMDWGTYNGMTAVAPWENAGD